MKRILEHAKKAIQINTVSHQGNEAFSGYLHDLMKERGLKVMTQHVTHSLEGISKRQFNTIGILGDPLVDRKTRKGLLFSVPTDTQQPGIQSQWTETGGNPWNMTVKEGKVFGLGAVHSKLDLLCKLEAIERFRERKLRQPVYLAATCGQELGVLGANYLIKSMALNPKYVLASQPTALKLVYRHKGQWLSKIRIGYQATEKDVRGFNRKVELRAVGKISSGAYPDSGVNAVLRAVDFLQALIDAGFEFRIANFNGGQSTDTVPDEAKTDIYLTSHQYEDFKRFFREYVSSNHLEKGLFSDLSGASNLGVKFLPEEALQCVFKLLAHCKELEEELVSLQDSAYQPAFTTMNISQIIMQSGMVEIYLDVRVLPSAEQEFLEKDLASKIQSVSQNYPMLKISLVRERYLPCLYANEDQELLSLCQDALALAHLEKKPQVSSALSEASRYSQAGFDTVVFGPGTMEGNSHCPNESVAITDLEKACFFYEKLIERVCL